MQIIGGDIMPHNAKICEHCGSLEWQEEWSETRSSRKTWMPNEDGEYEEEWDDDDYGGSDGELTGTFCSECGSSHLLDLEALTEDEILELDNIASDERVAAARAMLNGSWDDEPERKGKLIGKRVRQT
jgi:hypothetical protein